MWTNYTVRPGDGVGPAAAAVPLCGSLPLVRGGTARGRPHGSERLRSERPLRPILHRLLEDRRPARADGGAPRVQPPGGAAVGAARRVPVRHVRGHFHGAVRGRAGVEMPLLSARGARRVSPRTKRAHCSDDLASQQEKSASSYYKKLRFKNTFKIVWLNVLLSKIT